MLKQKKAKSVKMRGTSSHGWGHKKKHRGKGHRGGVGLSGTGARGDAQKSGLLAKSKSILQMISAQKGVPLKRLMKNYQHFGKRGFNSIHKSKSKTLSLNYIETNFDKLVENGSIVKEKSEYVFDSTAAGYNKILGKTSFSKKMKIICFDISESAKAKITEIGGSVEILGSDNFEEAKEE